MTDQMVTLKEWDWDNQCYMEREYSYASIKKFVERVRQFNKDRDPEAVIRYVADMERALTDERNERAVQAAEDAKSPQCSEMSGRTGEQCKRDAVEDGVCAVHRTMHQRRLAGTPA